MSLRDAQRIALAHLNAPAPMDPALWADQMRALHGTLQRIQVRDESVASAARLASVIAGRHEPVEATAFREALRDVEVTEWAQAGQQARSVAAILTHAAAPAITNPARRTLVAGVEQRLLQPEGPAPARPLTDALTRWQDTVTLAAPACGHPMVGASIAFQQAQLVRLVERTLDRVEAPAGDVERLRASLAQTREAWIAARERLMTNSWQQPTEPRLYSASQSIGMASSELTRALSSQLPTSPSHTLSALLGTSIGGQDTAALALQIGGRRQLPEMVEQATRLAEVAQLTARNVTFSDRIETTARTAVVLAQASPAVAQAEQAAEPPAVGIDVPTSSGYISDQEGRELAARRDAGVIAQAALDGIPEARDLVGDASPAELRQLVQDGATAKAELVASADRLGSWVAGQAAARSPFERDEAYSLAMLGVARAAATFDPDVAQWSTHAVRAAKTEVQNAGRRDATYAKHVTVAGERTFDIMPAPQSAIDEQHLSAEGVRQIMAAVDSLPSSERKVLASYLDRTLRDAPATLSDIASDTSVSLSTARRRLHQGRDSLREVLGEALGQRVDGLLQDIKSTHSTPSPASQQPDHQYDQRTPRVDPPTLR